MARAPYQSQIPIGVPLREAPVPAMADGSAVAAGLAGVAGGISGLARAAEATRATEATTSYLTRLDEVAAEFERDQDYATSPQRFEQRRLALESEILGAGRFSNQTRADLQQTFRRAGLTAQGSVDSRALAQHGDAAAAALDQQEGLWLRRYLSAGTDTARAAVLEEWDRSIAGPAEAGLISRQNAEARIQRRDGLLQEADVLELIRDRPDLAIEALQDPNQFPDLTAAERQRYLTAAIDGAGAMELDALVQRAAFNPARASLEAGYVLDPAHADVIFDDLVIWRESNGDPTVVSSAGALGLAQLMPGTARDVARGLGMTDVANLGDEELRTLLLGDPVLNRQLGLTYFRQMLTRYDGNVVLALAAYNAGPGRGDRWRDEAAAAFGPLASPQQILSVIDIAETSNYVSTIYGHAGADIGLNLPADRRLQAASQVGQVVASSRSAGDTAIREVASAERSGNEMVEMLRSGFGVADAAFADYYRIQTAAAERGDTAAAAEVRALDEAAAALPFVQEAWRMAPAALDAAIAQMQASANNGAMTGAQYRQLTAFEAVSDEIDRLAGTDPVALGDRAGLWRATPVDVAGDFASAALQQQLAMRDRQSAAAATTYQGERLPFHPNEAAALQERWANGTVQQRADMLTGLSRAMSPDGYAAAVGQIAGGDPYVLAAGMVAADRPQLGRQLLLGAQRVNAEGAGGAATAIRTGIAEEIGGNMTFPDEQAFGAIVDAALLYYAATHGANHALWDENDTSGFRDAIEAVAGEPVDRFGQRILTPPGMSAADFNRTLGRLTAEDLAPFGGAIDGQGNAFDAAELGRIARFVKLDPFGSEYVVLLPSAAFPDGVPVMTAEGRPLVVDVTAIAEGQATRTATEAAMRREENLQAQEAGAPAPEEFGPTGMPLREITPETLPAGAGVQVQANEAARALETIEALTPATFQFLQDQLGMTQAELITELATRYGVSRAIVALRLTGGG